MGPDRGPQALALGAALDSLHPSGDYSPAMRWILALVAVVAAGVLAFVLWPRPAAETKPLVLVSNYRGNTVSVVDPAAAREIKTIPIDDAPMGLALCSGETPLIAVANSGRSAVTLIDGASFEVSGTVTVGTGPEYVACSPDGRWLYVTSPFDMTVTVIDVAQRQVAGEPIRFDRKPGQLLGAPDGTRIYVALRDENGAVAAIDTTTRQVLATPVVGKSPSGIALNGDGTRLLAASFDDSTISVIDTATLQVIATHESPTGLGLLVHPQRPLAYSLASFDDEITVLDYESGTVVTTIELAQWPTYGAISADGATLYVPNEDSDNLALIDTATNAVTLRIAVGDEPAHALIVPGDS